MHGPIHLSDESFTPLPFWTWRSNVTRFQRKFKLRGLMFVPWVERRLGGKNISIQIEAVFTKIYSTGTGSNREWTTAPSHPWLLLPGSNTAALVQSLSYILKGSPPPQFRKFLSTLIYKLFTLNERILCWYCLGSVTERAPVASSSASSGKPGLPLPFTLYLTSPSLEAWNSSTGERRGARVLLHLNVWWACEGG